MINKLKIDPEFKNKIPPLTDAEFEQLKENILNDGEVYEPIAVWNGTIVDGHNRYAIIQEHPEIPFRIKEMNFSDKWSAFEWMYKKQLGRRNLTDEQRMMLIGKMYEARKKSVGEHEGNQYTAKMENGQNVQFPNGQDVHLKDRREIKNGTSGEIGKEFGIDGKTVRRYEKFAKGVDALAETSRSAAEKVLQGNSGMTQSDIREIPSMEPEQIKAIAEAIEKGPEETKRVVSEYKEPVKMHEMDATPLNPEPYNEDDFRDQVMTFPKEIDDTIRLFLMTHEDMLAENEYCKHAFSDMLNGIVRVAEKYRKEYLN